MPIPASSDVPASAPIALRIADVGKRYRTQDGAEAVALRPLSTAIACGEFVSLVGPSGCGKTTLLKMCAGLVAPSEGSVTFMDSQRPITPGHYGIVFQAPALLPWRTVLANVLLPADILGLPAAASNDAARALLDLVQLGHAADKYPRELSGGMQQRVSIARALLHDPEVLFMDEPFGALDAMTREDLNLALQQIHQLRRKTVVFVTHDIEEAVLLSDRVLVFTSGPGRLCADVPITLPRPRTPADKQRIEFRQADTTIRTALDRRIPAAVAAG